MNLSQGSASPSFLPSQQPSYRYVTKAPPIIHLSIANLLAYVPSNWIQEGFLHNPTMVELPCAEILHSHIPRISVEQLQKLIPQALHIPEEVEHTTKILLPTTPVALAYHLITERQEILAESPLQEALTTAEPKKMSSAPSVPTEQPPSGTTPTPGQTPEQSPAKSVAETPSENIDLPLFKKPGPRFFASLPTFVPASTNIASPPEHIAPPVEEKNLWAQDLPTPPHEHFPSANEENNKETLLHLAPKSVTALSYPLEPLSNEAELQGLFLTEERLSMQRVLDLCCQLPGIHNCVLARGSEVVTSSELPEKINPIALNSQASALLGEMCRASLQMGLGTLSTVTLFSSEELISFLHDGELCLFILHKSKNSGFIPGVREKLQLILHALTNSKPSLPSSP